MNNTTAKISVSVVSNELEWKTVQNIRRRVFIDNGDPEDEQFDGNDYCATHLIARLNDEAVGTFRIRLISAADGGSVIWERLSILPDARQKNPRIFMKLVEAAYEYTSMKSIRTVVGIVANPRLYKYWKRFGFKETGEAPIMFDDVAYLPISLHVPQLAKPAIKLHKAILAEQTAFLVQQRQNIEVVK